MLSKAAGAAGRCAGYGKWHPGVTHVAVIDRGALIALTCRRTAWLQVLVYSNPVGYQLALLRYVTVRYRQLPLLAELLVISYCRRLRSC